MPPKKKASSTKRGRDDDASSGDEGDKKFPDILLQWKDDDGNWNDFSEDDAAILVKAAAKYFKDGGSDKLTTKEMSFSTDNAVTFCFSDYTQLNEDTKTKRIFRCIQGKGVWEYKDDDGIWVAFYDEDSLLIEGAWRKQASGSGKFKTKDLSWNKGFNSPYLFTFTEDPKNPASPKAIQKNEESGNERILRRVEPKGTGAWDTKTGYGIAKKAAPTVKDALKIKAELVDGDDADADAGGASSTTTGGDDASPTTVAPATGGDLAIDMSLFDPPSYWEPQTKPLEFFTVKDGSDEYKRVLKPFEATLTSGMDLAVHSVKRIQNETLWKFYALTRYKVACRNGGDPNEMTQLFHGARVRENMDAIMNFGFDLRVARDGLAGVGVYFAVNSSYSNAGYVIQNKDGSKEMFVCRVACGTGAYGTTGMKRPPPKKGKKAAHGEDNLCDSVYRPDKGPKIMHVVFDNTQAIPEYLIHYTANWKKGGFGKW